LSGGVIGTSEAINYNGSLQSFFNMVNYQQYGPVLFNGATAGTNSVAQGVAANAAITGTGDWVDIMVLADGTYTLDVGVCNIAVDGVTYNESNAPGLVQ
jgi:hypothetical protein